MLAEAYDQFYEREVAKGTSLNVSQLYKRFRLQHPLLKVHFLRDQKDDSSYIELSTFNQKLKIGRRQKGRRPDAMPLAYFRLPSRARAVYDALFYADHHALRLANPPDTIRRFGSIRGDLLQMAMLRLDPKSAEGKQRLQEIEAEARRIVPNRIDLGLISMRPFRRIDGPDK